MNSIIGSPEPNSNTLGVTSLKKLSRAIPAPLSTASSKSVDPRSASSDAAEGGALGIYTKCSPKLDTSKTLQPAPDLALRVNRFLLQNVSRQLFLEQYYSEHPDERGTAEDGWTDIPLEDYNKLHKIVKCTRTRINRAVGIKKSIDSGKCFFTGLVVCGSVWACPVCAAKIQERRRLEISKAMDYVYTKMHKQCSMITLTFPHNALQTCEELREKQRLALKDFRQGGTWSRKMKSYGFEGLIRSLEITYGNNGWHPHTHELWIMDYFDQANEQEFKKYILGQWEKACQKYGLIPRGKLKAFRRHAVDVKFSASNSDYLAKADDGDNLHWGIDREMAKATSKISNKAGAPKKGLHPFQLLAGFSKGQFWMGAKYLEYVKAMKGASQLFWSRGLKKKCKIEELTDEEIIALEENKALDVSDLDMFAWEKVLELKAQAEILTIAEQEGMAGLINWFAKHKIDLFYDTRPSDYRRDDFEEIPKSNITIVDTLNLDFLHN